MSELGLAGLAAEQPVGQPSAHGVVMLTTGDDPRAITDDMVADSLAEA